MTTVVRITVSKPRDVTVRVRLLSAPGAEGTALVLAEEICDGRSCEVMFTEQIVHSGACVIVDEILPAQRTASADAPHVASGDAAQADAPRKQRKQKVNP